MVENLDKIEIVSHPFPQVRGGVYVAKYVENLVDHLKIAYFTPEHFLQNLVERLKERGPLPERKNYVYVMLVAKTEVYKYPDAFQLYQPLEL